MGLGIAGKASHPHPLLSPFSSFIALLPAGSYRPWSLPFRELLPSPHAPYKSLFYFCSLQARTPGRGSEERIALCSLGWPHRCLLAGGEAERARALSPCTNSFAVAVGP